MTRNGTADALPPLAAWRHRDARTGFEVAFFAATCNGHRLEGRTTAVEDGTAWAVEYTVDVDASWRTRAALVRALTAEGRFETRLEGDGAGAWLVDGRPRADLLGCLDVDLEASALTNALPVRRLSLTMGASAPAPAVYVRAGDLAVERLEQHYRRVEDDDGRARYAYAAPRFDYADVLVYDRDGLVRRYPGLAERVT